MSQTVFKHVVGKGSFKGSQGLTSLAHLGFPKQLGFSLWKGRDVNVKTLGISLGKSEESKLPIFVSSDELSFVKNSHKALASQFQQHLRNNSPLGICSDLSRGGHWRRFTLCINNFDDLKGVTNSRPKRTPACQLEQEHDRLGLSGDLVSFCRDGGPPPVPLLPPAKIPVPMVEKPRFGGPVTRQEMPNRFSLISELYAPSVYDFRVTIKPEISDPRKLEEIKCISKKDKYGSIPRFNYRNTIMHIRKRKIKKHHRLKWIKNNLAAIKYTRLRRNIKKEKLFRAEIFAAVREAENFDAEKYVDGILNAIDTAPKTADKEDNLRSTIALMRKYRAETDLITPEFDDPVKPVHENAFRIK